MIRFSKNFKIYLITFSILAILGCAERNKHIMNESSAIVIVKNKSHTAVHEGQPIHIGESLDAGGKLTASEGWIDIEYLGYNVSDLVRIKNGSVNLKFGQLSNAPDISSSISGFSYDDVNTSDRYLHLNAGDLYVSLHKPELPMKLSYNFSTPEIKLLSAELGSRFALISSPGETNIYVCEGVVHLTNLSKDVPLLQKTLKAGNSLKVKNNQLLPLADLESMRAVVENEFTHMSNSCK
jgi:hypothetical protein